MDLAERLLNPETVEAELKWVESSGKVGIPCEEVAMTYPRAIAEMADAIRELHRRLAAAKAEGAAARAELARAYRERDASIKELAEQLADLDAYRAALKGEVERG